MTSTQLSLLKPYWAPEPPNGSVTGPQSWVFFVVCSIDNIARPVAALSIIARVPTQGPPFDGDLLVAVCLRTVALLSDARNRDAIRGEMNLASRFYREADTIGGPRRKCTELPDVDANDLEAYVPEFPFISSCLFLGTSLNPMRGMCSASHSARLERLETEFVRNPEWGMVIFDITDLETVRYGIVAFPVRLMRLKMPNGEPAQPADHAGAAVMMRVDAPEPWPRTPRSADDYITTFQYHAPIEYHLAWRRLQTLRLVDVTAMAHVWPLNEQEEDIAAATLAGTTKDSRTAEGPRSLSDLALGTFVLNVVNGVDWVRLKTFSKLHLSKPHLLPPAAIRAHLLGPVNLQARHVESEELRKLVAIAFPGGEEHLELELMDRVSVDTILCILKTQKALEAIEPIKSIKSIRLCVGSLDGSKLPDMVDALSNADELKELKRLYFFQSPKRDHNHDRLALQLLKEMYRHPALVRRLEVMMVAGVYSAALCQNPYLLDYTEPGEEGSSHVLDTPQSPPLGEFPVQQMIVCHNLKALDGTVTTRYCHYSLAYAHLRPLRFAAGFVLYLRSIMELYGGPSSNLPLHSHLLSFAASPALEDNDLLSSGQVTPIPAETFALNALDGLAPAKRPPTNDHHGWTALVLLDKTTMKSNTASLTLDRPSVHAKIRYALVRPKKVETGEPNPMLPPEGGVEHGNGEEDGLQVVDLKEFMRATRPADDDNDNHIDYNVVATAIDARMDSLARFMAQLWRPGPDAAPFQLLPGTMPPPGSEDLAVLSNEDATRIFKGAFPG